jgi:hypothetical protein
MTRPTRPRDPVTGGGRKVVVEFRPRGLPLDMFSALWAVTEPLRRMIESTRSFAERISAVRETEEALMGLPKCLLRRLTVKTVRCPRNELLVRVVRIPRALPGARYDRYLVIPASATTYQSGDQRITESAWLLSERESCDVQCRCHPRPVKLTREQLRGESRRPRSSRVY